MTIIDIKEMVKSVVIEMVEALKLEREKEKNGKVLFVFCDCSAHEPFLDQMIQLRNEKIGYDCMFLDGETSSWLGTQQIESCGSSKVIASDEYAPAPIELVKNYDGIIIPEIDLDNSSRVVLGLKGTVKAEIIFSALVLNKIILVGNDVPGIKRADRKCLNRLVLPTGYSEIFKENIDKMTQLGILTAPQSDLVNTLVVHLLKDKKELEHKPNDYIEHDENATFSKKLLTVDWLKSQQNLPNNTLYLSKGVIISPLAKDMIKEKRLTVRYMKGDAS